MTRPDRLLTCALLGGLLLPGCVHTSRRPEPATAVTAQTTAPPGLSPYHGRPRAEVLAHRDGPKAEVLERLNYPEPPPRPVPMPPARPGIAKTLRSSEAVSPALASAAPIEPARLQEPVKLPEPAPIPEDPVVGALRSYLQGKPDEAGKLLDAYDRPTREALACLLPLAARYSQGRTAGPGGEDVPDLVDRLHGLTEPFRRKEPLRVDRLRFCRQIQHFGAYEPLPEPRPVFHAGCEGQPGGMMLVYAEVRNFVSQPRPPHHVTALASRAEIRDRQGQKVWGHDFGTNEDRSRSPRLDYFITYTFCVPCGLTPGDYTLWIEVTDTHSKPARSARRALDFSVVGGAVARVSRGGEATDQ